MGGWTHRHHRGPNAEDSELTRHQRRKVGAPEFLLRGSGSKRGKEKGESAQEPKASRVESKAFSSGAHLWHLRQPPDGEPGKQHLVLKQLRVLAATSHPVGEVQLHCAELGVFAAGDNSSWDQLGCIGPGVSEAPGVQSDHTLSQPLAKEKAHTNKRQVGVRGRQRG